MNVEAKNGEALFTHKQIENTPFLLVCDKSKAEPVYFAVIGRHRITDFFLNENDVIKFVSTPTWNLITSFVQIFLENFTHEKESRRNSRDFSESKEVVQSAK
jgi:hypothetical protein